MADLTMSGTIERVETTKRQKPSNTWETAKGGALKITVLVERPVVSDRPRLYGALRGYEIEGPSTQWTSEQISAELVRLEKLVEGDAPVVDPYAAKRTQATQQKRLDAYHEAEAQIDELTEFAGEVEEWEQSVASQGDRFRAHFAALAVVSALEGEPVTLTLRPDDQALQQLLPGMSALEAIAEGS